MSLRSEQVLFTDDLVKLLIHARSLGFEVTLGEVWRPIEMQQLYFKSGKSKTMNSQHLKRLAADLNLFKDGKLCTCQEIQPLGKYWESLSEKNRWGGSWRGLVESGQSRFLDCPHFERYV